MNVIIDFLTMLEEKKKNPNWFMHDHNIVINPKVEKGFIESGFKRGLIPLAAEGIYDSSCLFYLRKDLGKAIKYEESNLKHTVKNHSLIGEELERLGNDKIKITRSSFWGIDFRYGVNDGGTLVRMNTQETFLAILKRMRIGGSQKIWAKLEPLFE